MMLRILRLKLSTKFYIFNCNKAYNAIENANNVIIDLYVSIKLITIEKQTKNNNYNLTVKVKENCFISIDECDVI